ncbi:MAG: tetratricopeptide repeat protein [Burkholderiales bacterium]
MSLLMKALQKASQDRTSGELPKPPVSENQAGELALQPLETETLAAAAGDEATEASPALAATVMRAGETPGGLGVYIRTHPVVLFGFIAALVLIGGFIYILLAIYKPAAFTTPTLPPSGSPLAILPAPQTLPPQATPEPKPLFTESAEPRREAVAPRAARIPSLQSVSINQVRAVPTVDPRLQDGYTALRQNRLDAAQTAYQNLLTAEPNNVEALLGLAAIAEQKNQPDLAAQYYLKVVQADPRNAAAQAALLGLVGRTDPQASEARLKQLLERESSPFLYFTLGNLYAEQGRWPQAQQAYFQAHHLQPDNPDYAFNLAIGLEHLQQPKLALKFYQQALALAKNQEQPHFDLNLAQSRITRLSSLE